MAQEEPYLPPELERSIFEMAFDPDDLASNAKFILVAKRIREWIRPMIYSIFQHNGYFSSIDDDVFPDFDTYQGLNIEDIGKFAKHLHFGTTLPQSLDSKMKPEEIIQQWVQKCPNVEKLACWYRLKNPGEILAPIFQEGSKLRQLSISCPRHADYEPASRELWIGLNSKSLTHLDLMDCNLYWPYECLATYPRLTHFSAYQPIGWTSATVKRILDLCPLLVVFVLTDGRLTEAVGDIRIVLFEAGVLSPSDWHEGAKGRVNSWSIAERVVYARKHKYFTEGLNRWEPIPLYFDWDAHLTPDGKTWYSSLPKQTPRPDNVL